MESWSINKDWGKTKPHNVVGYPLVSKMAYLAHLGLPNVSCKKTVFFCQINNKS